MLGFGFDLVMLDCLDSRLPLLGSFSRRSWSAEEEDHRVGFDRRAQDGSTGTVNNAVVQRKALLRFSVRLRNGGKTIESSEGKAASIVICKRIWGSLNFDRPIMPTSTRARRLTRASTWCMHVAVCPGYTC